MTQHALFDLLQPAIKHSQLVRIIFSVSHRTTRLFEFVTARIQNITAHCVCNESELEK